MIVALSVVALLFVIINDSPRIALPEPVVAMIDDVATDVGFPAPLYVAPPCNVKVFVPLPTNSTVAFSPTTIILPFKNTISLVRA